MMVTSRLFTLAALVTSLASGGCNSAPAFEAGARIVDAQFPFPDSIEQGRVLCRLVDDLTGSPVVDAEVMLIDERETPIAGEFWCSRRATSDGQGFVRLDLPAGQRTVGWIAVRHPQHGVAMRSHVPTVWRLGRGFDVPVRIVDWLGRAQPGARVGFCGGCGHTPDLVQATADADGVAVLRGIDPHNGIADLYVQQPGLHYYYAPVEWRPGQPAMPVQCRPAPAMTGRLIDHRGAAVGDAYVCGGTDHRGPWARTAADGTFAILGAEPPASPHLAVLPGGRKVYFGKSSAWPVTLRLPGPDAVDADGAVEGEPVAADDIGRDLALRIEGAPGPVHATVEALAFDPGDDTEGDRIRVPSRGPFALVVWTGDDGSGPRRRFRFDDAASLPDSIQVVWSPTPRLTGRVVDTDGRAVPARVRLLTPPGAAAAVEPTATTGAFELAVEPSGWHLLEVAPLAGKLWRRLVHAFVPEGSGPVAIGDVRLASAPLLRVLDAMGAGLRGGEVSFGRAGWQEAGEWRAWPLDGDGAWCGPDLRAGDSIRIEREGQVPFVVQLQGNGPWVVQAPDGQLELTVVDAGGGPLGAVAIVGDHAADAAAGTVSLRGLPHGPTRVFIGARGCRSAVVDVVVDASRREVRVELPRTEVRR